MFQFKSEQRIPMSLDQVFEFFSKAENLEHITPAWLAFKIISPLPIEMRVGTIIDYRIQLYGIPLYWKTEITSWEPPFRFVDSQIRGPYSAWIHEHRFTEENGTTIMHDTVDYDIPAGILKNLVQKYFVQNQVNSIFEFRHKKIDQYFSGINDHHEI